MVHWKVTHGCFRERQKSNYAICTLLHHGVSEIKRKARPEIIPTGHFRPEFRRYKKKMRKNWVFFNNIRKKLIFSIISSLDPPRFCNSKKKMARCRFIHLWKISRASRIRSDPLPPYYRTFQRFILKRGNIYCCNSRFLLQGDVRTSDRYLLYKIFNCIWKRRRRPRPISHSQAPPPDLPPAPIFPPNSRPTRFPARLHQRPNRRPKNLRQKNRQKRKKSLYLVFTF